MQHPGGTCVALPNVDACPQLSCAALTFMYLQQVSSYHREDPNLHLVHVQQLARGSGVELENCMLLYSQGRMGMSRKTHCVQFVAV